jgi:hypothetical protein
MSNGNRTYDGSNRMCRLLKPPSLSNLHNCGNNRPRTCRGSSKSKRYGANSNSRICNGNKTCDGSNRMCRLLKPPSLSNLHNCGNNHPRTCRGSSKSKRYDANSNSSRICNGNKTCDGSNRIRLLLLRLLLNGQTFLREGANLSRRQCLRRCVSRRQSSVQTVGNNRERRAKTTRSRTSKPVCRAALL